MNSSNRINLRLGKFSKVILGVLVAAVAIVPSFVYGVDAKAASAEEVYLKKFGVCAGRKLFECFPDEAFANYVYEDVLGHQTCCMKSSDYRINKHDINAIIDCEEIDVSGRGCKVIPGLECFMNLRYLDCSNNDVEILNVYKCDKLQVLKCSNNPIRIINFGDMGALHELDCSSTQIESLNVDDCPFIVSINASNCNNLSELNLAGCSKVQSVNVSNCSNLEELNVIDAHSIKCINASNCEKLDWIFISPRVNHLDEININGSSNVTVPRRFL